MKKILLAASLLVAGATFAGTQSLLAVKPAMFAPKGKHIPASQVPADIMAKFNADYPTATNVQWQVEREHGAVVYQAAFTLNGSRMKVKYPA